MYIVYSHVSNAVSWRLTLNQLSLPHCFASAEPTAKTHCTKQFYKLKVMWHQQEVMVNWR